MCIRDSGVYRDDEPSAKRQGRHAFCGERLTGPERPWKLQSMPSPRVSAGKVDMKHPTALLGVLLICASPAVAQKFELPPLVEPASAEHHVGKVIWADLATPDLASAKRFYSGLFGWTFRDIRETEYAVAFLNGRPMGGLHHRPVPPGEQQRPAWLPFIAVRDVDAVKRTALEHGAKIVFEPRTYSRRGRQAVFADPEGAVFGVLASSNGDPGDFLAAASRVGSGFEHDLGPVLQGSPLDGIDIANGDEGQPCRPLLFTRRHELVVQASHGPAIEKRDGVLCLTDVAEGPAEQS